MNKHIFLLFTLLVASIPQSVFAGFTLSDQPGLTGDIAATSGVSQASVPTIIGSLGRGVFALLGLFFFILVFYGGFKWMTARGNEEETLKATKTISAAFIGLAIIIASYAITAFLQNLL